MFGLRARAHTPFHVKHGAAPGRLLYRGPLLLLGYASWSSR